MTKPMSLRDYCADRGRGTVPSLAQSLGVRPQSLWKWVDGTQPVPEERCPMIERETGGLVTCEVLRPDVVWVRVRDRAWRWHPKGRPLQDHVATHIKGTRCAA